MTKARFKGLGNLCKYLEELEVVILKPNSFQLGNDRVFCFGMYAVSCPLVRNWVNGSRLKTIWVCGCDQIVVGFQVLERIWVAVDDLVLFGVCRSYEAVKELHKQWDY